jgi:outer membrane lipoprotein SlyB
MAVNAIENEKGSAMTDITVPATNRSAAAAIRPLWLVIGGLALTGAGLAAGLAWRPVAHPGSAEATQASLASNEAVVDSSTSTGSSNASISDRRGTPVPPATVPAPSRQGVGTSGNPPAPIRSAQRTASLDAQPVAVCSVCGVVESVRETTQKGKGTGLGAVGGAVVGGAVGNQIGHGNGRSLMTILGAVGGGFAGNEIEKNVRSEKVYEVRVRMDDGSVRTVHQKSAPALGKRVSVEGNSLRTLHSRDAGSGANDPGMMRTSVPEGA